MTDIITPVVVEEKKSPTVSKKVKSQSALLHEKTPEAQTNVSETKEVKEQNTNHTEGINHDKKAHDTEKTKKPYNGYLRKSNRTNPNKESTENQNNFQPNHTKKTFTHKKSKPHHKTNQHTHINYAEEESAYAPTPVTKEHELISYIRQKNGFNPDLFWKNLDLILVEKKFSEIRDNDMSLSSYAILYSKDNIYADLLYKYGEEISQEDLEKNISNYSLNKSPVFIQETLSFYDKKYTPSPKFLNLLIEKVCKASYRLENNTILLNWLDSKVNQEHQHLFWNKCISEKNVVLYEKALLYPTLHTYLKNNYHQFEHGVIGLGKKHTTERALSIPTTHIVQEQKIETQEFSYVTDMEPIEISKSFLLPSSDNNKNTIQLKDTVKPQVTVKKRKLI